jgi:methylated-DNA-[protein]-cysteine S-methyltransferase
MNKKISKHTSKHVGKYTRWLDAEERGTALMQALDALYAAGPSAAAVAQAQGALKAALGGIANEVYYDQLPETSIGPVWFAIGEHGLVAVEYGGSEGGFVDYLQTNFKGKPSRSAEKTATVSSQLRDYLLGKSDHFEIDVDLSHITDFQRRVLQATAKVPRGQVSTYAEIARRIGQPKAVRAVGQALRRNPVPIVVPCHRVVASDGSLGGYGGEMRSRRKLELLKLEGVLLS